MTGTRVTVGKVEIIALVDTAMNIPLSFFFPGRDPADVEPYRSLYPRSLADGNLATQAGAYAIRSQGKTILCDTGIGPGPIEMLGGIKGRLLEDMREKGVPPEDVDLVVHTHLHVDHVGHNLDPNGVPNFPKAKYYAPHADWELFTKELDANPHMQQVIPLKESGALELFSGEVALTSEVTTYPTPGHTPGHTSLLISSGGEKAMVTGDLAHHPAQVDRIDWCASFDMDHAMTTETRRKVFEQMEADGLIAAFCHFPEPFGKLVRLEGKRVFRTL